MGVVQVAENLYWVGAIDWGLRDFHGYSTEKGSTYNAFLLFDGERATLFDTVKHTHTEEMLRRIAEVVPLDRIDTIVVNHAEMDHTGSLPRTISLCAPERVYCSRACKLALEAHFPEAVAWPLEVVANGETRSLGRSDVQFIETKMLHWPDSMFSYLPDQRVLISSDAFGQHYATSQRFDDEVPTAMLMHQAAKYYANILWPYSSLVQKLLESVEQMNLPIDMIAPDHGVIWRGDPGAILGAYASWSRYETRGSVVVVYDTMWHSTEKMADAVAEGCIDEGMEVTVMGLADSHRSDVVTALLEADALVLGSPTLNNGYLPRMADCLCYLRGLRPQGKLGAAFGSYGWGGESVKLLEQELDDMKMERVADRLAVRYVPAEHDLEGCRELGRTVARAVRRRG
ncbi:MAG: FprA family A-type flavoprotein [Synergistales bacterium]|nr:FprA family A-type flavoprotein [Synergistales bacterium]